MARHMKIDRRRLAEEALQLLSEQGLEGLSMRALAMRLGIGASALYWHIHNKQDLIGLVAAGIYERAFASVSEREWRSWLTAFGHALRREVLAHRDSARICTQMAPMQTFTIENLQRLVQPLEDAGLPTSTCLSYQSSVISLTLGWAIFEQRDVTRAFLSSMLNFDGSFAVGLEALVAGLPEPVIATP